MIHMFRNIANRNMSQIPIHIIPFLLLLFAIIQDYSGLFVFPSEPYSDFSAQMDLHDSETGV